MKNTCTFPDCKCEVPICKAEDKCTKGMTRDTCPYNPILGCDCGQHKPRFNSAGYGRIR